MTYRMVTANRLSDGACVYMDADGNWSTDIQRGTWVAEAEADALLERAADGVAKQIVIVPYLIEVTVDDHEITPVRFREQIRAKGPTIPLPA